MTHYVDHLSEEDKARIFKRAPRHTIAIEIVGSAGRWRVRITRVTSWRQLTGHVQIGSDGMHERRHVLFLCPQRFTSLEKARAFSRRTAGEFAMLRGGGITFGCKLSSFKEAAELTTASKKVHICYE